MQRISDILTPDRTLYAITAISKKKTLELIADTLSASIPICRAHHIFDALIARERLGSTAIGHGVAIPHARLDTTDQVLGCFVLLKESIDFDAQDHLPVDMIFSLIVPDEVNDEYLELLATIAQIFYQEKVRKNLREATSSRDLYERLIRA